jgi:hypothetical protein
MSYTHTRILCITVYATTQQLPCESKLSGKNAGFTGGTGFTGATGYTGTTGNAHQRIYTSSIYLDCHFALLIV